MRNTPVDQTKLSAQIILLVRSGRASSRRSIADAIGVSPSTIGLYVDHLITHGYLIETGIEQGRMGRPKRRLSTVAQAGWYAGLEFHAGRVQAVRVDFAGNLVDTRSFPMPQQPSATQVMALLSEAARTLGGNDMHQILGIGVGAPGVADPKSGIGLHYSFIEAWRDVPVVEELQKSFGVQVTLENNLRTIALAERWFGEGAHLSNYIILGPRRGFGIAIMHDGSLITGAHLAAGEIGNWWWPGKSQNGCEMHDELSAPAVWRRLAGAGNEIETPEDLSLALSFLQNSPALSEVRHDFAKVIGWLQLLLDTETFFLHGPLTALGDLFWLKVSKEAASLMPRLQGRAPRIVCTKLADNAGALGAASLAMEAWLPPL